MSLICNYFAEDLRIDIEHWQWKLFKVDTIETDPILLSVKIAQKVKVDTLLGEI